MSADEFLKVQRVIEDLRIYDREQVRAVRDASKPLARHICAVDHPVFGRYRWLDEEGIHSDLLDDMLWDALGLLDMLWDQFPELEAAQIAAAEAEDER